MKKIFIFLGAPGSGKGMLGNRLSHAMNIPRLATGDVLRSEVKKQSEIGRKIALKVQSGILIDDAFVTPMVLDFLRTMPDMAILDGYPRNYTQFKELLKCVEQNNIRMEGICLTTPIPFIVQRINFRRVCVDCGATNFASSGRCTACGGPLVRREDDILIQLRLLQYLRDIQPIEFALATKMSNYLEIDASDMDKAWQELQEKL